MTNFADSSASLGQTDAGALDGCHVPRITIVAFCDTPAAAECIGAAAADRRMSRASADVRMGGIKGAIEHCRKAETPDLIIIECQASDAELLSALEALADVCDTSSKLLVIGASNDVALYRALLDRGISEYLVAPVDTIQVVSAVSRVYRGVGAERPGKTYAFVGAKGGVGSSTIAHNVASTMARMGSDVVLTDMDLPFGTAGLDFNIEAAQGLAEAVEDTSRLDELLLDRLLAKCDERLSLLAAPAALERSYDYDETAFDQMLEIGRANGRTLVLDVPHMWTAWARRALVGADEVVITATPDLANLRNAKNLMDFLRKARPNDTPPKLVLNQVGVPKRPEIKQADFATAIELEPIAAIRFDSKLFGTAANKGQMIADASAKSQAARCFTDLARILADRENLKSRRKGAFSLRALFGGRAPNRTPKLQAATSH